MVLDTKPAKIVNLLGYDFCLLRGPKDGGTKVQFRALEPAARIRTKMVPSFNLQSNGITIPLLRLREESVVGLPAPQSGVVYVVSGVVASRMRKRKDVVTLGRLEYDDDGYFVGARALIQLKEDGEK